MRPADRSKSMSQRSASEDVGALLGLGAYSQDLLARAGITTRSDLEKRGAVGAFVAAKSIDPRASLNLLWGIAGALANVHWTKLEPGLKASLLLEYDAYCDVHGEPGWPSNNSLERSRDR